MNGLLVLGRLVIYFGRCGVIGKGIEVRYFDSIRLDGNVCMDCDVLERCVGVRDYKGFMGE